MSCKYTGTGCYLFTENVKKTLNKKSLVGYVGLDQGCRHCNPLSSVKTNFYQVLSTRVFMKFNQNTLYLINNKSININILKSL